MGFYETARILDLTFEALEKPPLPKPRSSDEMPETPEELADRKHREAGLDYPIPQNKRT